MINGAQKVVSGYVSNSLWLATNLVFCKVSFYASRSSSGERPSSQVSVLELPLAKW